MPVVVGAGAAGNSNRNTPGGSGGSSVFGSRMAIGGGGGGARYALPGDGGSGGGSDGNYNSGAVGAGTTGQGYAGGAGYGTPENSGGGGGARAAGHAGGSTPGAVASGGAGLYSDIVQAGTNVGYAGGGGGCQDYPSTVGPPTGGSATEGGGAGLSAGDGYPGTAGTGGGGGGAQYTFTGGAGGSGIVVVRYLSNSFVPDPTLPWLDGTWTRYGPVVSTSGHQYQEPSVMNDNGVWKMWYHLDQSDTGYATAPSPQGPWTPYAGNPVVTGCWGACVNKTADGVYHMFAERGACGTEPYTHDHLTSTDGITWTVSTAGVIAKGASGQWDDKDIYTTFVWLEDGVWYMAYEGMAVVGPPYVLFRIGIATAPSADGPWTKYAGNPVLGSGALSASVRTVLKSGSYYYMFFHGNELGTGATLPTDAYRAFGMSPHSWTVDDAPILVRSTTDEGVGQPRGQIADCCVVQDSGTLYMFYAGVVDGNGAGPYIIKLATAPSLNEIVGSPPAPGTGPTLLFVDLDLSTDPYHLQPPVDVGANQKTWDEHKTYASKAVAQSNVSEAATIDMSFPLKVTSDSSANLRAALVAINDRIDAIVPGVSQLVYDGTAYNLAISSRIGWQEDYLFVFGFETMIVLALKRLPD
jgi:hypothetical protein